jgi:hypothetical protein
VSEQEFEHAPIEYTPAVGEVFELFGQQYITREDLTVDIYKPQGRDAAVIPSGAAKAKLKLKLEVKGDVHDVFHGISSAFSGVPQAVEQYLPQPRTEPFVLTQPEQSIADQYLPLTYNEVPVVTEELPVQYAAERYDDEPVREKVRRRPRRNGERSSNKKVVAAFAAIALIGVAGPAIHINASGEHTAKVCSVGGLPNLLGGVGCAVTSYFDSYTMKHILPNELGPKK